MPEAMHKLFIVSDMGALHARGKRQGLPCMEKERRVSGGGRCEAG